MFTIEPERGAAVGATQLSAPDVVALCARLFSTPAESPLITTLSCQRLADGGRLIVLGSAQHQAIKAAAGILAEAAAAESAGLAETVRQLAEVLEAWERASAGGQ
jgi:hypothetical protein